MIYLDASQTVWSAGHSGIHVWDVRTHAHKATLPDSGRVTCLAVANAGVAGGPALVMSGHADGRVVMWSVSASGNASWCRELFSAGWDASKGRIGSDHRVTALCACSLPPLPTFCSGIPLLYCFNKYARLKKWKIVKLYAAWHWPPPPSPDKVIK